MINDKARIQVLDDRKGRVQRNTSAQVLQQKLLLNTSIRLQWKLQSGIQVSKSVQRKLHSEMCASTHFFFLKWSEYRETEARKWNKGHYQGCNSPGLEGYLR